MIEISGLLDKKTGKSACPLQRVQVQAKLDRTLAEVKVTQYYAHHGAGSMEALYTFPLPSDAQVTGFQATIGDKQVSGEFREKEEASRVYEQAVNRGDTALLLEQHRPNIFQFSLGRLEAGEQAEIAITYIQALTLVDEELRWFVPTVVAPRYKPSEGYIVPPIGKAHYTLQVEVNIAAGVGVRKVSSPSHPIEMSLEREGWKVTLAREEEGLDRDFVLTAYVEEPTESGMVVTSEQLIDGSNYAQVTIVPHWEDGPTLVGAVDYTFLIDVSGSMAGDKIEQAKRALSIALRNMAEGSRFQMIAFESRYHTFASTPLPFNQENLEKADRWIKRLEPMGGTEILDPLRHVLERRGQTNREHIVMLFTDGEVGNEEEIFRLVHKHQQGMRLFSFGIDSAVNEYFIQGLAKHGNGLPEFVLPRERIEEKVMRQFSRIHQHVLEHPVLIDEYGDRVNVIPPLPEKMFSGDMYTAWIRGMAISRVTLVGMVNGRQLEQDIPQEGRGSYRLLSLGWAKAKLVELEAKLESCDAREEALVRKQLVDISLGYGVLSSATSLVAVYRRYGKGSKGDLETVVVPVSMPAGWRMANADMALDEDMDDVLYDVKDNMLVLSEFAGHNIKMNYSKSAVIHSERVMPLVNNSVWEAAQKQQANGGFGDDARSVFRTGCFVIGMLLLAKEWKTYRAQLVKAGEFILQSGKTDSLVQAAAVARLLALKVMPTSEKALTQHLAILKASMTSAENKAIAALENGDYTEWLSLIGVSLSKSVKKSDIAKALLEKVVN